MSETATDTGIERYNFYMTLKFLFWILEKNSTCVNIQKFNVNVIGEIKVQGHSVAPKILPSPSIFFLSLLLSLFNCMYDMLIMLLFQALKIISWW